MTKISMVEFYIAKIESYMRRKHESILKVQEMEDAATSEQRSQSTAEIEEESKFIEVQMPSGRSGDSDSSDNQFIKNQPRTPQLKKSVMPIIESEAESDMDADLVFYDKIQKLK